MQIKIHDGFGTIGTFDTDDLMLDGNLYFSFEATDHHGEPYEGDFSLWFQTDKDYVELGHYNDETSDWDTASGISLDNPNNR